VNDRGGHALKLVLDARPKELTGLALTPGDADIFKLRRGEAEGMADDILIAQLQIADIRGKGWGGRHAKQGNESGQGKYCNFTHHSLQELAVRIDRD
jgi:hypothetical protein